MIWILLSQEFDCMYREWALLTSKHCISLWIFCYGSQPPRWPHKLCILIFTPFVVTSHTEPGLVCVTNSIWPKGQVLLVIFGNRGAPLLSWCSLILGSLTLGEAMSWEAIWRGLHEKKRRPPANSQESELGADPRAPWSRSLPALTQNLVKDSQPPARLLLDSWFSETAWYTTAAVLSC